MHRGRVDGEKKSPSVALHIGNSFSDAWSEVIRPWFESEGLTASASIQPVAVVVPHVSRAQFIRQLLLRARLPLLGVRFLTPPQLREVLSAAEIKLPLREHLRFLLAVAAEMQIEDKESSEEEVIAAESVRRAPDHLLRTVDELRAAGWSFDQVGPSSFRKVIRRFDEVATDCGFTSIQHADRLALQRAQREKKIFANLLVTGFDGAHWPLWPILQAAMTASQQSTVILHDPRDEARDLDECWVGTWEQTFGAAIPIAAPSPTATRASTRAAELNQLDLFDSAPTPPVHFLVGQEVTEEASAIVTLILRFLTEPNTGQIGVLFPAAGALSRSVAALICKLGVPHFDSIGHLVAPTLEDLSWLAWLRLQESNRLFPLLNFLSTLEDDTFLFTHCTRETIDTVLRRAFSQILIDDLGILGAYCTDHSQSQAAQAVAAAVVQIELLPQNSTLAGFVKQTRKIFQDFGWNDRDAELSRLALGWKDDLKPEFSRGSYLRWLREVLGKPKRARDPMGDHPYSRVHLLSFAEAEGHEWSHLVLAGLNEGAWPPSTNESDFVRDAEVDGLNKQIKILNRSVVAPGRHGEGQWRVQDGKTLCMGTAERRVIAQRQIANLVDSAASGLGITASLYTESVPRRIANPSEAFTRLYFETQRKTLSQTSLEALQQQTRAWIRAAGLGKRAPVKDNSVGQTRIAFDARRKEKPAGEFEFAFSDPPPRPISLSASECERLFKAPALVWMKAFLGVQADEEDTAQWNLAVGNWVHDWLRQIIENPLPDAFGTFGPDVVERVETAARSFRKEITDMIKKCGRPVPDWWISTWSNAAYIANCFASHLAGASDWKYAGTEWSLRDLPDIAVRENSGLKLRGRIDLILTKAAPSGKRFDKIPLWVVDYKTGKRKSLRSSQWKSDEEIRQGVMAKLLKGDGIQVALYAMALHQLGAEDIGISLLARGLDLSAPQLTLQQVATHEEIWTELARMQRTGIFGMRGFIRSEFGFIGDYPLATLPIDYELLENKWPLTHRDFTTRAAADEE